MVRKDELEDRKVWQYEIILLYAAGLAPKNVIHLGYSRSASYRWHSIYNKARKRLRNHIQSRNWVPLEREEKVNDLDDLRHE